MIYLIGMGPGHLKFLTQDAIEVIQSVEHNIAFGRISETARQLTEKVSTVNRLDEVEIQVGLHEDVAVLASGDACFFGILDHLQKRRIKIDRVIPGIASFQYMMSQLQMSWQHTAFFTMHGRDGDYEQILNSPQSVILTDTHNSPDLISRRLFDQGAEGKLYVGFDLSYDSEVILEKSIGDPIPIISSLSTMIVQITD